MYEYFTIEELRQCGFYRMEGEKNPYVWYFNGTPYGLNNPTDRNNRKFTINAFVNNANQYGYAVEKKKKGKNQKIKYYITKL